MTLAELRTALDHETRHARDSLGLDDGAIEALPIEICCGGTVVPAAAVSIGIGAGGAFTLTLLDGEAEGA